MITGMLMLYVTPNTATHQAHFGGTQYALSHLGFHTKVTVYPGFLALVVNLLVAGALTLVLRAAKVPAGADETAGGDYLVEAGEPGVRPLPSEPEELPAGMLPA
jgi:SSS family solute:Na+ symporter